GDAQRAPSPASDHELDDFIRHQLALPGEPLWQLRLATLNAPRRRRAIMNWTTLFATSWRFPASRCGS
ncbi:hypothetical protein CGQ19_25875, partial [Klebsiella quasipneumoniae]